MGPDNLSEEKHLSGEPERWLSGLKSILFLQKTWVWFPATVSDSSNHPWTPLQGHWYSLFTLWMPGLICAYPHTLTYIYTCNLKIRINYKYLYFYAIKTLSEARFINTQRQKLRFNLSARKAKEPATGFYLYHSLKWRSCLQKSQNEIACENCLLPIYIPL